MTLGDALMKYAQRIPDNFLNQSDMLSLLWPSDVAVQEQNAGKILDTHCMKDLDMAKIVSSLSPGSRQADTIEAILLRLCTDPHTIRYRQDILDDFLTRPSLCAGFEHLFPVLDELTYGRYREDTQRPTFHEVVWRLNELARLVESTNSIHSLLSDHPEEPRSEGLRRVQAHVRQFRQGPTFQQLEQELPDLLKHIETVKSITIGVNLNHDLLPVEATLLSVNDKPVAESTLMDKLFGSSKSGTHGIAQLHVAPQDTGTGIPVSPLLTPLFRDLAEVLNKVCQPLAQALKKYTSLQSGLLASISQELKFYTQAARLMTRLRDVGLPICKPQIASSEERLCEIDENYNLNLALHMMAEHPDQSIANQIITNTVNFGPQGRILLLTGPNKGGKTTYLQAIGLSQVLAQAGLYVPGAQAKISPVDTLHTHFPEEEQFDAGTGRFGDEAQRMHEIFTQITRHSLVLLNESFSSTSPAEALSLSRDIVRLLREMGTRSVFATHLHELAAEVDTLNGSIPGDSHILSLVASFIEGESATNGDTVARSYKIVPSPPMQSSRARELARQYGVSFDQLHELLRERGVMRET